MTRTIATAIVLSSVLFACQNERAPNCVVGVWKRSGPSSAADETRKLELAMLSDGTYAMVDSQHSSTAHRWTLSTRGRWEAHGSHVVFVREHEHKQMSGDPIVETDVEIHRSKLHSCDETSLVFDSHDGNDPSHGKDPWRFERAK